MSAMNAAMGPGARTCSLPSSSFLFSSLFFFSSELRYHAYMDDTKGQDSAYSSFT